MTKKNKVYQARGEPELDDMLQKYVGIGVNEAIRYFLEDIKNLGYGDVYDTKIIIQKSRIQILTHELNRVETQKELLIEELNSTDESIVNLKNEIKKIEDDLKKHQDNQKESRNKKLNEICNDILVEYEEDKENFNSINIHEIIEKYEIHEDINSVIGYIQNTFKAMDIKQSLIHKEKFDKGYIMRINDKEIEKIIEMLDDLKY